MDIDSELSNHQGKRRQVALLNSDEIDQRRFDRG